MWHAKQALNFALGLLGAFLLAAAVAAVPAGASHPLSLIAQDLVHFLRLDFGGSRLSGAPALPTVLSRLPATLELLGAGALIAFAVGAPLGFLLGRARSLRAADVLIQIVAAAPVFCAGLALLWLTVHILHITYKPEPLPWPALFEGGNTTLAALLALSLPALTVGAAGAAAVQLTVRRADVQEVRSPYRRGLQLMGLSTFEIDRLYLVPQILAALLAHLGEIALALISAAAVAEWLFGWQGVAVLFLKSVALGDWNVVAVVIVVFAALSLALELGGKLVAHAITRGGIP